MLHLLPDEILERLFKYIGFLGADEVLYGRRIWRSRSNCTAMALAVTHPQILRVFSTHLQTIHMDMRFRFGVGKDSEVATLLYIAGMHLRKLAMRSVSKQVGPRTMRTLEQRCPNLQALYLCDLPSVSSEDLANVIKKNGSSLTKLHLERIYVGNVVVDSIAESCHQLYHLDLVDPDLAVDDRSLRKALATIAPNATALHLSNLYGTSLVPETLLTANFREWPKLQCLRLERLRWLSADGLYSLCIEHLAPRAQPLEELRIVGFAGVAVADAPDALLSPAQTADVREKMQLVSLPEGGYGFTSGASASSSE